MDIQSYMHSIGRAARIASRAMAKAETGAKTDALMTMARAVERDIARLLDANRKDVDAARAKGLEAAMVDRLTLTPKSVADMAEGLRQIAQLSDPVGEISGMSYRPSGIQVGRMRVPLGVIGIIYEARPNVTADAAGLCLKSGNAAILRGGSEAIHSNQAIGACVHEGLKAAGLPETAVQVIETTHPAAGGELITMKEDLDQAIEHITVYGSQHTDGIVTEDITRARRFLREVDSASVMVNASTRFADGFEFGLGAEIGISTDKLHARGPVGLEGLTSLKFIVLGDGHIRE